jgi:hypothetical protein
VLVENTKESVTKESFDRCGVEVTEKKVRRDRVGHINLLCQLLISGISVLPNKIGYMVFHLRN